MMIIIIIIHVIIVVMMLIRLQSILTRGVCMVRYLPYLGT